MYKTIKLYIDRFLISSFIIISFLPSSYGVNTPTPQNETIKIQRLVNLCKLWGKVKYFHPSLAYRSDIDWDAALVSTIPKVRSAQNTVEYKEALQSMLNVLQDSSTRLTEKEELAENQSNSQKFGYQSLEGNILLITIGDYFELLTPSVQEKIRNLATEIPKVKAVVFDLRSAKPIGDYGRFALTSSFGQIERLLSTKTLLTAGERSRLYKGFDNRASFSSGQYKSGFYVQSSKQIIPIKDSKDILSVFLMNENAGLLNSVTALQSSGKGLIVFEGIFKGDSTAKVEIVDLGEGLTSHVRISEPIMEDGSKGDLHPDLIIAQNGDVSLKTAIELAQNFQPSLVVRNKLPSVVASAGEKSYSEMSYPLLEYRLLSAFRIWNIFNNFFPYKNLMDRDLGDVLEEFIPKFEQSKDALEYSLTVAEMVTHIQDSHGFITGKILNAHFGDSFPPIRVRLIEDSLVVTAFIDEKIAKSSGLEIGDIILKVDGEDAKSRFERYAKYIAASTIQSRFDKASFTFMNGADKSIVTLTIRNQVNQLKEIKLPRKFEDFNTLYNRERTGEITKLLPNNIGYADLDRLTADMIDEMFEKFKDTKAIIFDMRGYPKGIFWILPQRLTERKNIPAAFFETPLIGQFPTTKASESFFQEIFPHISGKAIYKGKTVMLIDERAMSQAEHTGLFFRAANGTTFIGSSTAGANGEVTSFSVPGGITIGFSGQSVKFPDGKQLQRIGLTPDIFARPTIKGIREGRDEVLEKAMQYLNQN